MRFCTLNLLDGESPGYLVFNFYLDYTITWVTTQGSRFHKHTHKFLFGVYVLCKTAYFLMSLFRFIIQIKERFYLTLLIFFALLNAA
jgi:hypothetical protein